jgi:hypothetical protein
MVTTITPTIVNLNVIETIAPSPSQLQQSGAIVSCGGTTLTAGMYQYCGSLSAVTALAVTPVAITTLTWSSGIATATVPAMTLAVGQTFKTTISGAAPAGYDGTYIATVATSTTFTYALTTNPGTETSLGTYTPPYSAFVTLAATTFFAQGSSAGVYVLELGPETTPTAGITALGTWITANSNKYSTPISWTAHGMAARWPPWRRITPVQTAAPISSSPAPLARSRTIRPANLSMRTSRAPTSRSRSIRLLPISISGW